MSIPYGLYDWLCFMLGGAGEPWVGWTALGLAGLSLLALAGYLGACLADVLDATLGGTAKPKHVARRGRGWE